MPDMVLALPEDTVVNKVYGVGSSELIVEELK